MSEDWFHCDWKGKCKRAPYAEIYPVECDKNGGWGWYYLCFWHFYIARLCAFLGLHRRFGWGAVDATEDDD